MIKKASAVIVAARKVIESEAAAIMNLRARVGPRFVLMVDYLVNCYGRIIATGVGKSGLVAQRFVATLRVGGTSAFCLHPTEAAHGDVGALTSEDVLVVFSRSGESDEIKSFVTWARDNGLVVLAVTRGGESWLAQQATLVLATGDVKEACPLGLTATTSVTVAGVMGDALALALQQDRQPITREDFAKSHPAGNLGRRVTTTVGEVMVGLEEVGKILPSTSLVHVMIELAQYRGTVVVEAQPFVPGLKNVRPLLGIVTAGDVARYIAQHGWKEIPVKNIMTHKPHTCCTDTLVADAITQMQDAGIMAMPVVSPERQVIGMIHLHDALRARVQ